MEIVRLRPANELTWDNYRWAYRECSRWLESWLPPWHWIAGFARTCRDLRQSHN